MQRRRFGDSGLEVSLVGLGCNSFGACVDRDGVREIVHKALDLGVDFFDTADAYGPGSPTVVQKFTEYSETLVGAALQGRRRDAVIATKCGLPTDRSGLHEGNSRRHIFRAIEDSLRRLGRDWIDIYCLHAPDPQTPIGESLAALNDLIRQGKVRYIATSNFAVWQVVEAHYVARELNMSGFIGCENEWSLLERGIEMELLPALRACGLGLIPFFPLASGLLTGKYKQDAMPRGTRINDAAWFAEHHGQARNWGKIEALATFCEARGLRMTEVAYKGMADRMQGLVRNDVQIGTNAATAAKPMIDEGKLKPLFIVGDARHPQLPNVPTNAEVGLRNFRPLIWQSIMAPSATPRAIQQKINADVAAITSMPDYAGQIDKIGMLPFSLSPKRSARSPTRRWRTGPRWRARLTSGPSSRLLKLGLRLHWARVSPQLVAGIFAEADRLGFESGWMPSHQGIASDWHRSKP